MTLMKSRRKFLWMSSGTVLAGQLAPSLGWTAPTATDAQLGRSQSMDLGWSFTRSEGVGFEHPDFNDGAWRIVDVPHDWGIEDLPGQSTNAKAEVIGPFSRQAIGGTAHGYTVGGTGWYRKRFSVSAPNNARVHVRFDGVYMNSEVWLNGVRLGEFPNGYAPFTYDLTPHLRRQGANVLAVKVRNEGVNSRWYSGSGIYRHVWLDVFAEPSRIAPWGVSVDTQSIEQGTATLALQTNLVELRKGLTLASTIVDARGTTVWQRTVPASAEVRANVRVSSAALWSPDTPNLYTVVTELRAGKKVLDRTETIFGIRIVTFDAATGMTINGSAIKLKGGCIHHDNGLLGAAAFDEAEDRKIRLLKQRGYNAVRPSHNQFSDALLTACDRHGMFVISEAFDAWRLPKQPADYANYFDGHWKNDLTTLVLSGRHHPSIIMWSIGNEIPGRNLSAGIEAQWRLANLVHELDPYRPVTAAINDFVGRPMIASEQTARAGQAGRADEASFMFLDIAGYNYKLSKYERDHALYPSRIMYGSESFAKDMFANWALIEKSSYLIGDFVWTAMDYLGEAGLGGSAYTKSAFGFAMPGTWPWVNASCGDLDLTGAQRAQSRARDVAWGLSKLEVLVQTPPPEGTSEMIRLWGWSDEHPTWTWPGAEGRQVVVRVYTRGDRVELRLNGRAIADGKLSAGDMMRAEFQVDYQPGQLEVVAFSGAKEIGRKVLETAEAVATVAVVPERKLAGASRNDIAYVAIELQDARGRHVHGVTQSLHAKVSGPAEIVGFGSGAWSAVDGFQDGQTKTFNGRAQLILRSTGSRGLASVTINGEGVTGSAEINFG